MMEIIYVLAFAGVLWIVSLITKLDMMIQLDHDRVARHQDVLDDYCNRVRRLEHMAETKK